jgi:hypothetical protein
MKGGGNELKMKRGRVEKYLRTLEDLGRMPDVLKDVVRM